MSRGVQRITYQRPLFISSPMRPDNVVAWLPVIPGGSGFSPFFHIEAETGGGAQASPKILICHVKKPGLKDHGKVEYSELGK
jgi:hypothetical protein